MPYILLKNGLVLTFKNGDPEPHAFQADVLIKDNIIIDVKPGLKFPEIAEGEVVDCTGKWVTPGQIDTHRHVWMSLMRGQQADMTLVEYLIKVMAFQTPYITPSEARIGTLTGCLEALYYGITTVVDHVHVLNTPAHAPAIIEAHIASSIRSKFCYARVTPVPKNFAFTAEREEQCRKWQIEQIEQLAMEGERKGLGLGMLSDRVGLGLAYEGLRGSRPVEDNVEKHKEVIELARKYKLSPITTHYVGGPSGGFLKAVQVYSDVGVLSSDLLFSHCSHIDEREWELLRASGAAAAITPEDELGMGHGPPVAYEAVKRGVRAGLGCDCVSVQSADLFTQMRVALQWQRGHDHAMLAKSSKPPLRNNLTSASAFRLATLGGAEAIHMEDKIGTIESGKLADIVVINAESSINLAGAIDPIQGYVFWTKGEDVESVIVNGEWVKRGGKLVKVRWEDVVSEYKEAVKSVESRRLRREEEEAAYTQCLQAFGCVSQ